MTRFSAALATAVLAALAAGCSPAAREPAPAHQAATPATGKAAQPNVVLLLIDTLRADKMGCYGFGLDTTPELDVFAKNGVRFRTVIAQSSWTRPSIASLLTSRYPRSVGIFEEQEGLLDGRFELLSETLQGQGYTTIGATANPHLNRSFNFHQGFNHYLDTNVVYTFMKRPGDDRKLFKKSPLPSAQELFDQVFSLIAQGGGPPYYVQLCLMEVHEWYRGGKDLTRDAYRSLFPGDPNRKYLQPLRQISQEIDTFVQKLLALPGWSDTLFVIVSDHGEGLDDHPNVEKSRYHGRLLYESQLRVPLILYRPGWTYAGRVIERPVRLLDLMPTLLECAGAPVPAGLDGVSLMPLLQGGEVALPPYFVAETELREHDKAAVYGSDWKYIENYDQHVGLGPRELQAMGARENGVRTDRLAQHPDTAQAMAAYLEDWKKRYPKATPVTRPDGLSPEETEQLKAIGYLGD